MSIYTAGTTYFYIVTIAFITLSVATIISNTLALVAFVKLKYYQKVSGFLLVLLSVEDLMIGVVTDTLIATQFIVDVMKNPELTLKIQYVVRLTGFNLTLMSIFTMVAICYEMYLSLLKPLLPPRRIGTVFAYHLAFCFFLVLGISLLSTNELIWETFQTSTSVILVITFLTLCVIQFRILRETGRIAAFRRQNYGKLDITDAAMKRKSNKIAQQILIAFGITFVPYIMVMIFDQIWKEKRAFSDSYLRPWAYFFAVSSSLVNPFLHSFRLKRIRNTLLVICRSRKVRSFKSSSIAVTCTTYKAPLKITGKRTTTHD